MTADVHATDGRVLVVCTGNICRSPYIERSLAHALGDAPISVESAGLGAVVAAPIHPPSAKRLRAQGISPDGFAARQLTMEMLLSADLIVGAAQEHVDALVATAGVARHKSFTYRELAYLLRGVSDHDITDGPASPRAQRVALAAARQRGRVPMLKRTDADIADPYLQPEAVYDAMITQVNEGLPDLVAALRSLDKERV